MDLASLMDQITAAVESVAGTLWVYLAIFGFTTIDGFFPPVPSESLVVSLAALSMSSGEPSLALLFLAAAGGAMAGDNIAFQIGHAVHPSDDRGPVWLRGPRMQRTFAWARRALDRRGAMMILVARHIPGCRVAVNMMAGATGYPRRRFVALTLVAAVLWAAYGIGIGAVAGHWIKDEPLLAAALAVAVAIVLGVVVDRIFAVVQRRRGRRLPHEAEEPISQS
ncbi:DedA family protein [Naumannella halotolerans]|uniref:DedA family protein n=1 Tax=Naumannella halotolerans TaxID=993414 RepID=UPI00370DC9EB